MIQVKSLLNSQKLGTHFSEYLKNETDDHIQTKVSANSHCYLAFQKSSTDLAAGSKRTKRFESFKRITHEPNR